MAADKQKTLSLPSRTQKWTRPAIYLLQCSFKRKAVECICYGGLFTEGPWPVQVLGPNVPSYHKGRIARKPPRLCGIVPIICTAHLEVTEKGTSQPMLLLPVPIRAASSPVWCSFFSFVMDNRRSKAENSTGWPHFHRSVLILHSHLRVHLSC